MFDYHAGEKFKIMLIGTALCAFLGGMFIMALVGGSPDPHAAARAQAREQKKKLNSDYGMMTSDQAAEAGLRPTDVRTGPRRGGQNPMAGAQEPGGGQQLSLAPPADYVQTNSMEAQSLIETWLPFGWDMSAGTASDSQERAMQLMTPACAEAYRKSLWTPELAKQIEESGLKSSFKTKNIKVAGTKPDGAIVVEVEGEQVLEMEGKGSQSLPKKLEYLVKKTDQGVRITGISEGS